MVLIKANYNGEIRRIALDVSTYSELQSEIQSLFGIDEFHALKLQYKDEDGDEVTMSSDREVETAVRTTGDGILRLSINLLPKSGRSQSVIDPVPEHEHLTDKQRSASVIDQPDISGLVRSQSQQKPLFGGRGRAVSHDTFSRKSNFKLEPPTGASAPRAASVAAQVGLSASAPPMASSVKGKAPPGLGLKLDLKAVKGDYEGTPVPNLPAGPSYDDSDSEDESTEGESSEETGEEEDSQREVVQRVSQKAPPGRSFSSLFGINKKKNGLKRADLGTIKIINHAPAPQLPCRCHSGLGDEFGIAPGTYWTFLLCETSTALELLKQIKEKLGCELVHIALFSRTSSNPPKDTRIADDQKIFPLKESWQKKNLDMKFVVKERPFGESVKDTGVSDDLKRLQYKLQVTAQAPQVGGGSQSVPGGVSGRTSKRTDQPVDVLSVPKDEFVPLSAMSIKKTKKFGV